MSVKRCWFISGPPLTEKGSLRGATLNNIGPKKMVTPATIKRVDNRSGSPARTCRDTPIKVGTEWRDHRMREELLLKLGPDQSRTRTEWQLAPASSLAPSIRRQREMSPSEMVEPRGRTTTHGPRAHLRWRAILFFKLPSLASFSPFLTISLH